MQLRELGKSKVKVAPLMFGGNVFGWTADEATSMSLLDALADAGLNFIDTADVYSEWAPGNHGGDSETIIGKWFKRTGKRDQVVLATKVGSLSTHPGLSRDNILKAADDSLRRLQTDYIDLYFSHRDFADSASLCKEEVWNAGRGSKGSEATWVSIVSVYRIPPHLTCQKLPAGRGLRYPACCAPA